jgi:hypothetical protein
MTAAPSGAVFVGTLIALIVVCLEQTADRCPVALARARVLGLCSGSN